MKDDIRLTGEEIFRLQVGDEPNNQSLWYERNIADAQLHKVVEFIEKNAEVEMGLCFLNGTTTNYSISTGRIILSAEAWATLKASCEKEAE